MVFVYIFAVILFLAFPFPLEGAHGNVTSQNGSNSEINGANGNGHGSNGVNGANGNGNGTNGVNGANGINDTFTVPNHNITNANGASTDKNETNPNPSNGNDSHTNGDTTHPNGGTTHPNGGTTHPNGGSTHPNGGTTHPTENTTHPTVTTPEGNDGTVPGDNGTTTDGDDGGEDIVPGTPPTIDGWEDDPYDLDSRYESEKDKVANQIVGRIASVKYLASIRVADSFNMGNFTHRCSGALVTTTVVVSVAHCLHDQFGNFVLHPETYRVMFGRSAFSSENGLNYVIKVAIHHRYLMETRLHDLSMFKLKEPQRVLLPELSFLRPENLPNTTECEIHFWSHSTVVGEGVSLVFLSFRVSLQKKIDCYFELGTSQHYLTPDHKCFYYPPSAKPACFYNGGSPLTCADIVVGLFSYSSFGQQSEILAETGIYVDLSHYVDKIYDFSLDIDKASYWTFGFKQIFIHIFCMLTIQKYLFEI